MKVSHKHVLLNTHKIHGMKSELRIIIKVVFFFSFCIVGSSQVKLQKWISNYGQFSSKNLTLID